MAMFTYTDPSGAPICAATPTVAVNGKFYVDIRLASGRSGTPNPRPLYRLPGLSLADLIVIVGDEESADALAAQEIVSTAILGGPGGLSRTDWSPLNRSDATVMFCLDKSPTSGCTRSWAKRLRKQLPAIPDEAISILEPLPEAPEGWTLAQSLANGDFDIEAFLATALPVSEMSKSPKDNLPPKDFADAILDAHGGFIVSLGDKNPTFYAYEDHADVWRVTSDQVFKREALDLIGQEATPRFIDGVLSLLHTMTHHEINPFEAPRRERIIHAADADIRVNDDGSLEVLQPDPLRYTLSRLATSASIDDKPACPRFIRFLTETFTGDDDLAEKINFLQELVGLCLLPSPEFPLFTILYGSGSNGKSVLLEIIGALVGPPNMAAVGIEDLSRQFGQINLVGKLVNLVGEIGVGNLIDDRLLKLTTSGDPMQVDRKYHDPFTTRIHVKTILSTNTVPHLRDLSHAVMRRLRFITFNKVVPDRAQNRSLARNIIDDGSEMSGILHWAIEGLVRVIKQHSVTEPPSSKEAIEDWSDDSNPLGAFIRKECKLGIYEVEKDILFGAYQRWCGENSVRHPVGKHGFTNALNRHRGGPITAGHSGNRRFYRGITLKGRIWCDGRRKTKRAAALAIAA